MVVKYEMMMRINRSFRVALFVLLLALTEWGAKGEALTSSWYGGLAFQSTRPAGRRNTGMQKAPRVLIGAVCLSHNADSVTAADDENTRKNPIVSRRQTFVRLATVAATTFATKTQPAWAGDAPPTVADLELALSAVRFEVFENPKGGVALMQVEIDQGNFAGLMELTKTYDLELRKVLMGKAKKIFGKLDSATKEQKEKSTLLSNAVTFDLIGINRSSRPGQEDAAQAQKYLDELKDDVKQFLDLLSTSL